VHPPEPAGHPETVVLLVAHGSRNPRAAQEHEQLCIAVTDVIASAATDAAAPIPVRPAYLEITSPSIPDAIDAAVAEGATEVRLLPHFLSSGNHVLVDLPAAVATARERHPGVRIELRQHLGADPALVELVASKVAPDATKGHPPAQ
jgi:sirohydrochlorin ferrochelatase